MNDLVILFLWLEYMQRRGEMGRSIDQYIADHDLPNDVREHIVPLIDALFMVFLEKLKER